MAVDQAATASVSGREVGVGDLPRSLRLAKGLRVANAVMGVLEFPCDESQAALIRRHQVIKAGD